MSKLFLKEIILYGVDPLGGVRDLERGSVLVVVFVDEIDLHHRLVQVVAFDAVVRVDADDFIAVNVQLKPGGSAAVKNLILQEQQKPAAFSRLARFAGPAEIVHPEAHGQDLFIAKTVFDPIAVTPADKGNVADDAEKDEGNEDPSLVGVEIIHNNWYLIPDGVHKIFKTWISLIHIFCCH